MLDKYIVLNNGVKIPQFGLGTWFIDDDKAADAVKAAAEMGYRHIDTAQAYGNERGVGEGVRNCGIPREEMIVVPGLSQRMFALMEAGFIATSTSQRSPVV